MEPKGPVRGDHRCAGYRSPAERLGLVEEFLAEGHGRREDLLWVGPLDHAIRLALEGPGRPRPRFASTEEIYGPDGELAAASAVGAFRREGLLARRRGLDGFRAVADLTGAAVVSDRAADGRFSRLLAYEQRIDEVMAHLPLHGLCLYDRTVVDEERYSALACAHSRHAEPGSCSVLVRADVVHLAGELDARSAPGLARALDAVTRPVRALDVTEVRFLDAAAGRALAEWARHPDRGSTPPVVTGASRLVGLVLDVVGLGLPGPVVPGAGGVSSA